MRYLKAGEIRQVKDQYRTLPDAPLGYPCHGTFSNYWTTKATQKVFESHIPGSYGPWTNVTTLLGQIILRSDLMHLQFRRP